MLKFFSFKALDNSISNPLQLVGALICVYYAFVNRNKKLARQGDFYKPIMIFLTGVFISDITCLLFHDQDISNSLIGQRAFYCYFMYFFLYHIDADEKFMLSVFKFMFICVFLINTLDIIMIGNPPFSWRVDERRSSVSIFYYGRGFLILGSFYYLQEFLKKKNLIYFAIYGICTLYSFLNVSRMLTIGVTLGSALIFLRYSRKGFANFFIIIIILVGVAIVLSVYADKILGSLFDLTQKQLSSSDSDVRTGAYNYFFTSFQPSVWTQIFGNGVPYNSAYEDLNDKIREVAKARVGDVGLVGVWVYFGFLAVISWLMVFYRTLLKKISDDQLFIRAYMIVIFAEAFTGFATHNPEIMPTTIFALYWFERLGVNKKIKKASTRRTIPKHLLNEQAL
ncbi:hypothetical protein [Mucilaginibacter celer]|nr:hypothetical protein [Mucilaginibacter celer]